ncbi:MAG TPA: DnaB-like helicase N-terminal domain-containing protein, partial [Bacteroidales bacterium]|nr:DnaB-like helicase N-terminal domain-containing protein [Bacteroidales bacterium]
MAVKKSPARPAGKGQSATIEYGKMPPQALDMEEVVLGAVMLEKDAILSVIDIIKPESFYKEAHQKIFKAVIDLSIAEKPIDIMTVTEELRSRKQLEEVGGPFYIAELTSRIASAANIDYHARIIEQKYIQRELIRVSSE